jgi:AhpD family alkylhydroperoxidase
MRSRYARKEFEDVSALVPGVYEAAAAMGAAINASGLSKEYLELAKIRASQLNGCAQCLGIHLNNARALGMDPHKLEMIPVWREAGNYDDHEMAVLRWAELLTDLAGNEITDEAFAAIHTHFTEAEVAALSFAIAQINFYNRLGAAYHYSPPRYRPAPGK